MQNWSKALLVACPLGASLVVDQPFDPALGASVKAVKKDPYYQSQDMLSFRPSRYITCWCEFGSQLVVDIGSGNVKREFI
jgi:hypothetical protein